MNDQDRDQTLALAGIFQAARLVQQLARDGRADHAALAASVHSVFAIESASTIEIYGGIEGVALGLQLLRHKLSSGATPRDLEVARYVIATLQLQSAFMRREDTIDAVRAGIETINAQQPDWETPGENSAFDTICEQLADLYSRTLSTLSPRIMVSGEPRLLADKRLAARIRAVLFAGIRSAVLWRQLGGSRWQLLFGRAKLSQRAGLLLTKRTEPAD